MTHELFHVRFSIEVFSAYSDRLEISGEYIAKRIPLIALK